MDGSLALTFARLFIRFILGILLISVALSKLLHQRDFRSAIQDYHVISATLDAAVNLSGTLSSIAPPLELLLGLGIIHRRLPRSRAAARYPASQRLYRSAHHQPVSRQV